jgi:hypothetical protein
MSTDRPSLTTECCGLSLCLTCLRLQVTVCNGRTVCLPGLVVLSLCLTCLRHQVTVCNGRTVCLPGLGPRLALGYLISVAC